MPSNTNQFFQFIKTNRVKFVPFILVALLFTFSLYGVSKNKTEISKFSLTASASDAIGTDQNSHFLLKSTSDLSEKVIEKYIKFSPEVNFDVKKIETKQVAGQTNTSGNEGTSTKAQAVGQGVSQDSNGKPVALTETTYEIIPKEKLNPDQVYTVQIVKGPIAERDFSWAYQIKAPFEITSSLPKDKGTNVPPNTGIEIYFNRDNLIAPENYFEISPKVEGKFVRSEEKPNAIIFVPQTPLDTDAIYTVKVKKGLRAQDTTDFLNEEKTIVFQTLRKQSWSSSESGVWFNQNLNEYKPDQEIVFSLNTYNVEPKPINIEVYKFESAKDFIDSIDKSYGSDAYSSWAAPSISNIPKLPENKRVLSANVPIEKGENIYSYSSRIRLPQKLGNGYYIAYIGTGKNRDVTWFQVSPIARYVALASKDSVLWLKDTSAKGVDASNLTSVAKVPVLYDGKVIGKTDDLGALKFKTPEEFKSSSSDQYRYGDVSNKIRFLVAQLPTGDIAIPLRDEYGSSPYFWKEDSWWDYISTNKNIYLPTDTIHFWSVFKPREGIKPSATNNSNEIEVSLTNSYWGVESESLIKYSKTNVKLSEFGTVTGDISFSNLRPGIYNLNFKKGNEVIASETVTVGAYVKPVYRISLIPSVNAIFAGDSVSYKIKAEFFDGTPVSNIKMEYDAYGRVDSLSSHGILILNSNGEGVFTVNTKYEERENDWWPNFSEAIVRPVDSEEGSIEAKAGVMVFGPHIRNDVMQKTEEDGVHFTVKTQAVDISRINSKSYYVGINDYVGGPVPNNKTTIFIDEVIYNKTLSRNEYDPINKTTYPVYNYSTEYKPLYTREITSDQTGITQLVFNPEQDKTYRLKFNSTDSFGRKISTERYAYGKRSAYATDGYNSYEPYSYSLDNNQYDLANLDKNKQYKINDKINLQIQTYQGITPKSGQSNFIFLKVHSGQIEYTIQDNPKYFGTFLENDTPNVGIWSGWFENGKFHSGYMQNISYDTEDRRLNLEIKKDKEVYAPGETVNLEVRVTDKNKNPVSAEVNLSAVDEAVFSLNPEERDILSNIYRDVYERLIVFTSHKSPYGGGGAEKGGGADEAKLRSKLEEVALFKSVTTGYDGKASVSFKLPDNVTSWRLTSQAITKDLFAGKSTSFITVTLPLFVDATLNKTYLEGDTLIMRLRAFGERLNATDKVNFSVESETLPLKKESKPEDANSELGHSAFFNLGKLTEGTHTVIAKASNGNYADALSRPINVVKSYFTKKQSDYFVWSPSVDLNNKSKGITQITFGSIEQSLVYGMLYNISCGCGQRIDQAGASYLANKLLNDNFGAKEVVSEFNADKYQDEYTGGIQLLPYSSDELELSAITANIFNSKTIIKPNEAFAFDKSRLERYFQGVLNDKKTDSSRVAIALFGLSSLDKPVLTKIQKLKNDASLKIRDKIYVALALYTIGAKEEARSYYNENIYPKINEKKDYAYISDRSSDQTIITTTLAGALAVRLDDDISPLFINYADNQRIRENINSFEKIMYIQALLPKLDKTDVSLDYSTKSKSGSKKLKNGEMFSISLLPEELSSLKITNVTGKLGIVSKYEAQSSPKEISKDSNLLLTRTYRLAVDSKGNRNNDVELNDGKNTQKVFHEGDIVEITITPIFKSGSLDGTYEIVDYLPSGLRSMSGENDSWAYAKYGSDNYYGNAYLTELNDQKLTFITWKGKKVVPARYYARVITKGTYKAEPATLQSTTNMGSLTITDEDTIKIE